MSRNLLADFVETFQTEFDEKIRIFLLIIQECFRKVVETDTALSQQVAGVLRTTMHCRKANSLASIFSVASPPLL